MFSSPGERATHWREVHNQPPPPPEGVTFHEREEETDDGNAAEP
jgi:hypothetical protein